MAVVAKAKVRFLQVQPRKVRLLARQLKGVEVLRAQALLSTLPRGACRPVAKVLASAVANATREGTWKAEQLVVSKIFADQGPALKRFRAAPMGRATPIHKRMCHLTIELDAKGS